MNKWLLIEEEIGNLEWAETPSVPDGYVADFSFVDDYPKEVKRLCQAQLRKVVGMLDEECVEHEEFHRSDCPECWLALRKEAGL